MVSLVIVVCSDLVVVSSADTKGREVVSSLRCEMLLAIARDLRVGGGTENTDDDNTDKKDIKTSCYLLKRRD